MKCDNCGAPATYRVEGFMKASDMAFGLIDDRLKWERDGLEVHVCDSCASQLHPKLEITKLVALFNRNAFKPKLLPNVCITDVPGEQLREGAALC